MKMDLVGISANPVPKDTVCGMIATRDNRQIRFARWPAIGPKKCGTVCLFTGRAEFIEKYFETIDDLRRRGFAVAAIDWRGQGGSSRGLANERKGHVEDFTEYERDVDALMGQIVLPDCPPPYFALAHSMGGAILLRIAARPGNWFERMVLSAPMVDIGQNRPLFRGFAEVMLYLGLGSGFVPGGGATATAVQPFKGNPFTSDRRRHDRTNAIVEAQPRLAIGAPTIAWFHAACETMQMINETGFAASLHTPVLMIAAGNDRVVSTRATERLGLQMRNGKALILPGAQHELLMENNTIREMFLAAFDSFVPGGPVFDDPMD